MTKEQILAGCFVSWPDYSPEQIEDFKAERDLSYIQGRLFYFSPDGLSEAEQDAWIEEHLNCLTTASNITTLDAAAREVRELSQEKFGIKLTLKEIKEAYRKCGDWESPYVKR